MFLHRCFWWAVAALEATGSGLFLHTAANQTSRDLFWAAVVLGCGCGLGCLLAIREAVKRKAVWE
jgi:hypothetical protein